MASADYQPTLPQEEPVFNPELRDYARGVEWLGQRLFDRYEIHEVRQGGVGLVFFVTDLESGREYSVKTIRPEYRDLYPVEQFFQEIDFWIRMDPHPNIVRAYFVERRGPEPYLFLERVDGGSATSLRERLRAQGTFNAESSAMLIHQLALGMEFANSRPGSQVVHADLKPENLLVDRREVLKITDFGLAHRLRLVEGKYPRVNMGSWPYAPPERFLGQVENYQSDQYAAGVIWYEMLTGRYPYPFPLERDPQRQYQQLKEFHQSGANLARDMYYVGIPGVESGAAGQLISSCLDSSPGERFRTWRSMRELIEDGFPSLKKLSKPGPSAVDSPEILYQRANSLLKIEQYSQALRIYNRLLLKDARSARLWAEAGLAYLGLSDTRQGVQCLRRAIEIDPGLESGLDVRVKEILRKNS